MPYIYVLGMDGKPQMPTKRRRHVQKLLDTGRARIAGHVPFTIQLREAALRLSPRFIPDTSVLRCPLLSALISVAQGIRRLYLPRYLCT